MIINIHRLLARISYLQGRPWSITDLSKASLVARSTLVKVASGKDVNISSATLEKLISVGIWEIRKVLTDRDRLSDERLRKLVLTELVGNRPNFLSTKRQVNNANRVALESFTSFPDFPDDDGAEL